MRPHALRLPPGADLREEIEAVGRRRGIAAGCILTVVGSLTVARLRAPGPIGAEDRVQTLAGPLEILALSGTLSLDGVHLHIAVAGADGVARGGHLLAGSLVHTTAELVIGELTDVVFRRRPDAATGYAELEICEPG